MTRLTQDEYNWAKEILQMIEEDKLLEIAKSCLDIESWDTCRCDDAEAHNQVTLPLVDLHQALQLAYAAGRSSTEKE